MSEDVTEKSTPIATTKTIYLDKGLLYKISFCVRRIEVLRKRLLRELNPKMEELEVAKSDFEEVIFRWEQQYSHQYNQQTGIFEGFDSKDRSPNEVSELSKSRQKIRGLEREIIKIDRSSDLAKELNKYKQLKETYEDQACALAKVLPRYVNWESGVAEIPTDLILADISAQVEQDFKTI